MKYLQMLSYHSFFILMLFSYSSFGMLAATRDSDDGGVKIQPEITVDDNSLKPSITFSTNGEAFSYDKAKWLFEFRANSGIDVGNFEDSTESSEEIISEYVADGGNIEFDLSLMWRSNDQGFGASVGPFYSLLTTDAISTQRDDASVLSVDAEVYGLKTELTYKFQDITTFVRAATYDTSDDGVNVNFTSILDDGYSVGFGIDLPLSALSGGEADVDGYVLRFERTKHSEIKRAIFRVSITRAFDLFNTGGGN